MDELAVRVEPNRELQTAGASSLETFRATAATALQRGVGVRAIVDVVEPGSFERSEHKARRVIDDRNLFESLHGRNEA